MAMIAFTGVDGKILCFVLGIVVEMNIAQVHALIAWCQRESLRIGAIAVIAGLILCFISQRSGLLD